jgi:hypothetical protein
VSLVEGIEMATSIGSLQLDAIRTGGTVSGMAVTSGPWFPLTLSDLVVCAVPAVLLLALAGLV